MQRVGSAHGVWCKWPILAAGLALLTGQSTPAEAQRASAGGSVSIEQPVGGSFAFDLSQSLLSAVFLTTNGNSDAQTSNASGVSSEFGFSAGVSPDEVSVGFHDLGSSVFASQASPDASLLATGTALPPPRDRTLLVLAQFN